jgi:hypothetical protein
LKVTNRQTGTRCIPEFYLTIRNAPIRTVNHAPSLPSLARHPPTVARAHPPHVSLSPPPPPATAPVEAPAPTVAADRTEPRPPPPPASAPTRHSQSGPFLSFPCPPVASFSISCLLFFLFERGALDPVSLRLVRGAALLSCWSCGSGFLRAELGPIGARRVGIIRCSSPLLFAVKIPPLLRFSPGRFTGVSAFQILLYLHSAQFIALCRWPSQSDRNLHSSSIYRLSALFFGVWFISFSLACLPFYYAGISHDLAEGISVAAVSWAVG